jgi:anti-sigma regulatory factor (Ser/Thr protein kinase)
MPAPPILAHSEDASSLRLTLATQQAALDPARTALLAFLGRWELSARLIYRLELVLEEVLMNIVWHATPAGQDEARMILVASVDEDAVTLQFEDAGPAFDPTVAQVQAAPTRLVDAAPGGLGITLVRKFATTLHYRRDAEHNVLTATFLRQL